MKKVNVKDIWWGWQDDVSCNDACPFHEDDCNGTIKSKFGKNEIGYEFGCYACGGNGEEYLGDGVFSAPCTQCCYLTGPKKYYLECNVCYCRFEDNSRKVLAKRIRSHLSSLVRRRDRRILDRIESTFTDGMTWDNRDLWHIDHIKPVKYFLDKGISDPQIVNDPKNLQALWADDNLKKGAN